jgi:hypothetical protein
MADPKIEEFVRAHDFKPSFLRDMQRYLRDTIQPLLDERDRVIEENHRLHEELIALKKKVGKRDGVAA